MYFLSAPIITPFPPVTLSLNVFLHRDTKQVTVSIRLLSLITLILLRRTSYYGDDDDDDEGRFMSARKGQYDQLMPLYPQPQKGEFIEEQETILEVEGPGQWGDKRDTIKQKYTTMNDHVVLNQEGGIEREVLPSVDTCLVDVPVFLKGLGKSHSKFE